MADQRSSGNSGWYSGGRNPYDHQLSQVGMMSQTRTASGIDYHETIIRQAAEDQAQNQSKQRELQKVEVKQEEEDIYYLLT
jgi:hypothetical protein